MNRNKWMALLSVAVVLSFVLSACGQAATPTAAPQQPAAPAATQPPAAPAATKAPTAVPSKYTQAPTLDDLVKSGKLPPVDQRVSDQPLVMKPIAEVGQYGGTWRIAWKGPSDFHAYQRLNYEPILRWPRNPKDPIQPGLAYKWEFSPDGKSLTLYFRKGLKWSDGQPWTVDDIIFWWEDIETEQRTHRSATCRVGCQRQTDDAQED